MSRQTNPDFQVWVDEARRVPILDELSRRGAALKKAGLNEYVGPCPACGGKDRFSVNVGKGVFHCRGSSTGGDVIALVRYLDSVDFGAACATLTGRDAPGKPLTDEERAARKAQGEAAARASADARAQREATALSFKEREQRRCHRTWRAGVGVEGSPVAAYLALRGIVAPAGAHLRYAAQHPYFVDGSTNGPAHHGPAMLGAITTPAGRFSGLHITWLDPAQPKGKLIIADEHGDILPAKKVRGSQKGGRIELVRQAEPRRLFLGEGIETVLSVWRALQETQSPLLRGAAFWSAVSLGNLAGKAVDNAAHPLLKDKGNRPRRVPGLKPDMDSAAVVVPDSVTELFLLGDGDSDAFTTDLAMNRAARRHSRAGRTVRVVMAPAGCDFNDLLREVGS